MIISDACTINMHGLFSSSSLALARVVNYAPYGLTFTITMTIVTIVNMLQFGPLVFGHGKYIRPSLTFVVNHNKSVKN